MKWLSEGENPVLDGPRASVDWKGICEQVEALQRQFDQLGLSLNAEQLCERFSPSGRDYGVLAMFGVADEALSQHGFEIVQFDTGGDSYAWQIVRLGSIGDLEAIEREQQPEDIQ